MYNSKPMPSDLPSSAQLLKSTVIAAVSAVILLVGVVMPAEYGIDPTGVGKMLGLTDMGEIKVQLAEEAEADALMDAVNATNANAAAPPAAASVQPIDQAAQSPAAESGTPQAGAQTAWRDELRIQLTKGQGAEVKLSMKAGERAEFSWAVEGGVVNFDTHGDGGGRSISYEKGRGVPSDEGSLEAAFDGNHGWFWRNRGDTPVTVIIRAAGQYGEMKRVI